MIPFKKKSANLILALFCVVFFFDASHAALPSEIRVYDFKQALEYAIEHSPRTDTAKKNFSIAELEQKNALAKLLPSLDLTSSHGLSNNILTPNSLGAGAATNPTAPWQSQFGLKLSETIYDNGGSWVRMSQSNRLSLISEIQNEKTRDELALDLTSEFFRYSLAVKTLEVKEEQLELLRKQLRIENDRYRQGMKMRQDFLRFQTSYQRSEIDVLMQKNTILKSAIELRRIMGDSPTQFDDHPVEFKAYIPNFDQIKTPESEPKVEGTYEYRVSQLQSEVNQGEVTIAELNYYPNVFITGQALYQNTSYLNSPSSFPTNAQGSWNALIGVNYNIWDFGILRRRKAIAEIRRLTQENDLFQNYQTAFSKIKTLGINLKLQERTFKLNQELLKLEEMTFTSVQKNYREGNASFLDLTTSLSNLQDARIRLLSSSYDLLNSLASHGYYQGNAYEILKTKL